MLYAMMLTHGERITTAGVLDINFERKMFAVRDTLALLAADIDQPWIPQYVNDHVLQYLFCLVCVDDRKDAADTGGAPGADRAIEVVA